MLICVCIEVGVWCIIIELLFVWSLWCVFVIVVVMVWVWVLVLFVLFCVLFVGVLVSELVMKLRLSVG